MNTYFLLRHGESLRNVKDIAVCFPEKIHCPLTKKGQKEIKTISQEIKNKKIDLIFASDLLRTKQTAEIVGKAVGLKPRLDKRLREVNVGILNGKPVKEVILFFDKGRNLPLLEYYKQRFHTAHPKGETYTEIEKRMYGFLKELDKKYKGKNILIVSHERPISLLEKAVYKYDLKKFTKFIKERRIIKTGELRKLRYEPRLVSSQRNHIISRKNSKLWN